MQYFLYLYSFCFHFIFARAYNLFILSFKIPCAFICAYICNSAGNMSVNKFSRLKVVVISTLRLLPVPYNCISQVDHLSFINGQIPKFSIFLNYASVEKKNSSQLRNLRTNRNFYFRLVNQRTCHLQRMENRKPTHTLI